MSLPPPFPHQVSGVQRTLGILQQYRGAYMRWRVGTGKTRGALGVAKMLKARKVLVIGPLVTVGVWKDETAKWWPLASCQVLRGEPFVPAQPDDYPHVVVTNYDQLSPYRCGVLQAWGPDLLILDEAHYIKDGRSQRHRYVKHVASGSRRIVLLSGTPADNPLDWWAQYRLINPNDFEWINPFSIYREKVAVLKRMENHAVYPTAFRPEVVQRIVRDHVEPYTSIVDDVLNLPEPLETPVRFDLGDYERHAYNTLKRDAILEVDGNEQRVEGILAQYTKLFQICSGFIIDTYGVGGSTTTGLETIFGESKKDAFREVIEQDLTVPTVIATTLRRQADDARDVIVTHKLSRGVIDGSTPQSAREEIVRQFQDGKLDYVILNYQAGGVGITLTRAKRLILYGLPFSSILLEQMIGRVWRAGQTGHVQILPLLANDTLEVPLWSALKRKLSDVDILRILEEAKRG